MALLIQKKQGTGNFHTADGELETLYGRVSTSNYENGLIIDVKVRIFGSKQAWESNLGEITIEERANIELQKRFAVAGSSSQTIQEAHNQMASFLQSLEGGEYQVQIVDL